jgi:hypothetical protein
MYILLCIGAIVLEYSTTAAPGIRVTTTVTN